MNKIYFSELDPSRLDEENGIVYGVCVCAEGVAKGHDLRVTRTTLQQLFNAAQAKGDKIPTKIDHKSGLKEVCGYLTDFHLDGSKLRANWHLLKSQSNFPHTWETIEKLHDVCGLSCSFTGDSHDGIATCRELISCDFVPHPACQAGLFSRGDLDHETENESDDSMNENDDEPTDLEATLHAILEHQAEMDERLSAIEDALDALEDDDDDESDDDDQDDDAPVIRERGARSGPSFGSDIIPLEFARGTGSGVSLAGYPMSPLGSAMSSIDFAQKVEALRLTGLDEKTAWCRAAQNLARKVNQSVNLP
jgi:hypothetical protein